MCIPQCGGLLYTAIPFNGWYADVEVIRDLCDHNRYNMLQPVAEAMGLDTSKNVTLWKDQAQVVLTEAVIYSFEQAKVAMVDHHTLIEGFFDWYKKEHKSRGFCPGNWKWVVPPQVRSISFLSSRTHTHTHTRPGGSCIYATLPPNRKPNTPVARFLPCKLHNN